jgi:hypothetical protein
MKAKLTWEALQFVDRRHKQTDENVAYENLKLTLLERFSANFPIDIIIITT